MIRLEVLEVLDVCITRVTVPASFAGDIDRYNFVFWNASEPLHDHIGTGDRDIMFSRSRSEKYSDFHNYMDDIVPEYRNKFAKSKELTIVIFNLKYFDHN